MNNRILAVFLTLIMILMFAVNASAVEDSAMPDLTGKGSLTLIMELDGVPLDSGRLNLYRVADIIPVSDGAYGFSLVDDLVLAGATLDTDDLYDDAQAKELLEKSQLMLELYSSKPIEDGKVYFDGLETGLYLVWQCADEASDGYDAISPFLISVPKWQDGAYEPDVVAKPKVPLVTEPSPPPPPPPPPPPELPQTGQLNWPVAVMGAGGAVLLIVGLILCADRKRRDSEK
ncbi:MAG: LPXTG cell wall anchor domain-containing protein [Clostridia bacterium]|nr:LPXTG cell wall anchor domain-containing protein [Clostridia bacterium]